MSMPGKIVFRIGADLEQIDAGIIEDCQAAMAAAARSEAVVPRRTVTFETWDVFFRSLTPNRIGILEHVAKSGEVASTRALALALSRDYAAVHSDVAALLKSHLLERDGNALRCEVDPGRADLIAA
jgi:predicted transcriptional regulator